MKKLITTSFLYLCLLFFLTPCPVADEHPAQTLDYFVEETR